MDIGSRKPCLKRFNANARHCNQSVSLRPKLSIDEAFACWVYFSNKFVDKGEKNSEELILVKKIY